MATAYEFRKGIYWHRRLPGGGSGGTPPTDCNLLFLNGNTAQFLDGDDWRLLGCNGAANNLLLLNGNDLELLDGDTLELLG